MASAASLDTGGLHGLVPPAATLGIRLSAASPMHGGPLMSLADTAGAVCAFLNLPDGSVGTTTIARRGA